MHLLFMLNLSHGTNMGHFETALTGIEAISKRIEKAKIERYINELNIQLYDFQHKKFGQKSIREAEARGSNPLIPTNSILLVIYVSSYSILTGSIVHLEH